MRFHFIEFILPRKFNFPGNFTCYEIYFLGNSTSQETFLPRKFTLQEILLPRKFHFQGYFTFQEILVSRKFYFQGNLKFQVSFASQEILFQYHQISTSCFISNRIKSIIKFILDEERTFSILICLCPVLSSKGNYFCDKSA